MSEVRVTDPVTGGQKGIKEERFDLIPYDALEEIARVYGVGAKKYEDHNWLKGYKWGLSAGALGRHFARWMLGEDRDPETGCHHLAHAAWHCLTLITFQARRLGTDDRKPPTLAFKPKCPPDSIPPSPVTQRAPATPAPWAPKVGDRVRVVGQLRKGSTGTVIRILADCDMAHVVDLEGCESDLCFYRDELEPAPVEAPAAAPAPSSVIECGAV